MRPSPASACQQTRLWPEPAAFLAATPAAQPRDEGWRIVRVDDSIPPAVGEITHLSGRLLRKAGGPIRNAFVEIWQVDNKGSYIHSGGAGPDGSDENFQGCGRFRSDVRGDGYFRTIMPVPGGSGGMSRAPRIHIAVSRNGKRLLTTQVLVEGYEKNDEDGVLRGLPEAQRPLVLAAFNPLEGSKLGELSVDFDIVLGVIPPDFEDEIHGGLSKSEGDGPRGPGGPRGQGGRPPRRRG